jgi:copper chaperone CopZ
MDRSRAEKVVKYYPQYPSGVSYLTKEKIDVGRICCYSCSTTVEKEVSRLPGVKEVSVDYKKGIMTVEYDGKKVKREKIEKIAKDVIHRMNSVS